jgi:aryl-alcohol dehydrogenase-like predicted oxidoreductase
VVRWWSSTLEQGPRVDAPSIVAAVEGELRRLQTDHLDLIQLHWPDRYVPTFGAHQYHPEVMRQPCSVVAFGLMQWRDSAKGAV